MRFEWDEKKARSNATKHDVTFEEAATLWTDPFALIAPDPEHSSAEEREWIIGRSHTDKILVVVFTIRGKTHRIISARKATRNEKRRYEEEGY